jgi:isopentenyldiphosphate isomerase
MAESIDIYNANLDPAGSMDRGKAHMDGRWHRTFHCWVVNPADEPRILFQVRSDAMVNFPGMLDVSAAGHILAGESLSDGVREVREELGVAFDEGMLHALGDRVEVADQANGQKNREYQSVYLLLLHEELAAYEPQVEEIAGLVWLGIGDGLRLFAGDCPDAEVRGIKYDASAKAWRDTVRTVTSSDFLPRIQRYYLTAAIMADRLVKGQFPLAIS